MKKRIIIGLIAATTMCCITACNKNENTNIQNLGRSTSNPTKEFGEAKEEHEEIEEIKTGEIKIEEPIIFQMEEPNTSEETLNDGDVRMITTAFDVVDETAEEVLEILNAVDCKGIKSIERIEDNKRKITDTEGKTYTVTSAEGYPIEAIYDDKDNSLVYSFTLGGNIIE